MGRRVDPNGDAEEVGLHLEQRRAPGEPSVDTKPIERPIEVGHHCVCERRNLCGDAFDHGPDEVLPTGLERKSDERAASTRSPERRAQPGKGRHERHTTGIANTSAQQVKVGRRPDDSYFLQPTNPAPTVNT